MFKLKKISGWESIVFGMLILWAVVSLLPLYWMFSSSFKSVTAVVKLPPEWFPVHPTMKNYINLLSQAPVLRWIFNSAVVAFAVTGNAMLTCSMAGYALAKKKFPGDKFIFWLCVGTMMVPWQVWIIPLFKIVVRLGWVNTYTGLIVPALACPFGVFLMRQFTQTLPSELIDAGRIDGCGEFGIYWRIILPLSKPALALLGIFIFVASWNNFIWPLIVTSSGSMRTLPVGLTTLQTQFRTDYGLLMAGSSLAALPVIILFLGFQKYFIKEMTLGAIR